MISKDTGNTFLKQPARHPPFVAIDHPLILLRFMQAI